MGGVAMFRTKARRFGATAGGLLAGALALPVVLRRWYLHLGATADEASRPYRGTR